MSLFPKSSVITALALVILAAPAWAGQNQRNCPANVAVHELEVPGDFLLMSGAEISSGLASALQAELSGHANVMSVPAIIEDTRRNTEGKKEAAIAKFMYQNIKGFLNA